MRFPRRARVRAGLVGFAIGLPGCGDLAGAGATPGPAPGCPATDAAIAGASLGADAGGSSCATSDSDGIVGGCSTFDVEVDDEGFSPLILKAQNRAQIVLRLTNAGTTPHDFAIGCISVLGCPGQVCFPPAARVAPLAPGASATTTFVVPLAEGIYPFRSDVAADSAVSGDGGFTGLAGQFVLQ